MASIQTGIELRDQFTSVVYNIIDAANMMMSTMDGVQRSMNANVDTSGLQLTRDEINRVTEATQEMVDELNNIGAVEIPVSVDSLPEDLSVPVSVGVQQPQIEIPDSIVVPVTAEVTEQPVIDVPDGISVDVTPVVTEQPVIETPDDISVEVSAIVADQPQIDVPDEITVPVTAEVTEQPVIDVPDGISVDVTPVVTEQPVIETPDDISVEVSAIVADQPQIDVPDEITVPVTAEVTEQPVIDVEVDNNSAVQRLNELQQQLQSLIPMQEAISATAQQIDILPKDTVRSIADVRVQIQQVSAALEMVKNNPFEMDASTLVMQMDAAEKSISNIISKQQELDELFQNIPSQVINVDVQPKVPDPLVENPDVIPVEVQTHAPPDQVTVPVEWQADNLEVFTNTGIERFEQEVQSANTMLNTLNQTQQSIQQTAAGIDILPDSALQDINTMGQRLQTLQSRIQQIENNPINMGTDAANAELEQLRSQLNQAVMQQEELNAAMRDMDISAANQAYLELSNTVSNTERYIRDNTDEQGTFNSAIQQGQQYADGLSNTIAAAVTAFLSLATIKKAWSFISDSLDAYDTQLNAETQLMSVLANMLDADYVAEYAVEVGVDADTSGAIDEINAISANVDDVEITVDMQTAALQAEFDAITEKASEIQASGIYGDEAMIAGAAELATYFTDTDAITMMMDTLADYAMGMSGGGEIDSSAMVEYATNLGKIMSGSYDAMTKKGFEFTDAQEAIIEGTATEAQIVETLGEEYLDMSADMQAAAAITQVIDESWAGLYETMSDTPEGKIIQMTNAWGDMKEVIASELYPYVLLFVDAVNENWDTIQSVVNGFTSAVQVVMGILSSLLDILFNVAAVITDNWSVISPIIYGIVAALAAYMAISTAVSVINGIHAASEATKAAAQMMATDATFAETAAQYGLNAALAACPLTWIIVLIIALVALLVVVANKIAEVTGIANSGFGVITGGINVVIAFFQNLGLTVANIALGIGSAIAALASNMMTAFSNAISSIQSWFYNLLSTALTVVEGICEALNKLPFVEFDYSGISSAADEYASKASEAAANKGEYQSISDAFNEGFSTFSAFSDGWASDAFDAGASWGDGSFLLIFLWFLLCAVHQE